MIFKSLRLSHKSIFIPLALGLLFLTSCSHTIHLRASHFAVPVVANKTFSPRFDIVGTPTTKVTLVDDITTNPPTRTHIKINDDSADIAEMLFVNQLSLDGGMSLLGGTEVFFDGGLLGLRWQFLNHNANINKWVSSIHGAYGGSKLSRSINMDEATTDRKTNQVGLSIGYQNAVFTPYLSYIYEKNETKTDVRNTYGTFGPYEDKGIHQYVAIGIAKTSPGFSIALELNLVDAFWNKTDRQSQLAGAARIGYHW